MNSDCEYGVILESGASDWQIFQQDDAGVAAIPLACVPFDIPGYRPLLGFTLPIT